jgi:hypothetical protein
MSEELALAAQMAELRKTKTVLEALVTEISRNLMNLERRQAALNQANQPRYRY